MHNRKYKFGFLGLSGSGKTCILAALDMQRRAHPAAYTSALLPVEVPPPPMADKETWTNAQKEAYILHQSSERLSQVKKQLEQGTVPMGTELSHDFIFDYEFSSEKTGTFQARIIDYGGELVNPEGYAPEKIELRQKLAGMDGLFVVAPAPHPTKKDKAISEFLNLLQNTLTRIPFEQPIILLINKWDRIAPLPEYTISQRALKADELPTTEHRDLYNALINKVGEANCKAFPLSAFGEYEQRSTAEGKQTEFPKHVNPLASFGLLEGFIRMTQRLDTIRLENYEQQLASYKKWIPYPSTSLSALVRQGKKIFQLFPKEPEMSTRALQARQQYFGIWKYRLILLLSILLTLPIIGVGTRQAYQDNQSYNKVHSILNDPKAQFDELKKAEQWLENYYYTSPNPLSWIFVVSNKTAKSKLEQSRDRREQGLWQLIENAPSLENRLQAGENYLGDFPNGKRIAQVKTIVLEDKNTLRQQRETQWWRQVEQAQTEIAKLGAARQYLKNIDDGIHKAEAESIVAQIENKWRTLEEQRLWQPVLEANSPRMQMETAQSYLQEKPDGQHAAEAKMLIVQAKATLREQKEKRWWQPVEQATAWLVKVEKAQAYLKAMPNGKHAAEANLILVEHETRKDWTSFKIDYYDWLTNGDFLKAAQYLSQRQPSDEPKLQALKQQFRDNFLKRLEAQIKSLLDRQKWSDAYRIIDDYNYFPDEFKNQEKAEQMRLLRGKVQEAEDRFFYSQFLKARNIETADNYLSSAPLQRMQAKVKEYKNYLIKMRNPLGLTLILSRIEWGDFNEGDNTITVFMDGKKIIEQTGVDAEANNQTGEIGRRYFTHKLNTPVTIQVKIVENNWLSSDQDSGQARKTIRVAKLNGYTLNLYGKNFINKAVFLLEGIPRKPYLSSWE